MFELDEYLGRIGTGPGAGLAAIHRAHATTIPFENLDPYRGIPVSLALDDIQDKLVSRRRGGYCFEQNLLFKAAAEALGASVEMFLARVRVGAEPGVASRQSHLVLRITDNGERLLADVGFGRGTLLEPIPFAPGDIHTQNGWQYRLVDDGAEHVLQLQSNDGWIDLYGFAPVPVPLIDVETSNWWVCTNPNSRFVTGFVAGITRNNGTHWSLSDWDGLSLTKSTHDHRQVIPVSREQIPDLLGQHFNLAGFTLDAEGRLATI
jgi:N-hydroxyarylamine O-acetyltransferase